VRLAYLEVVRFGVVAENRVAVVVDGAISAPSGLRVVRTYARAEIPCGVAKGPYLSGNRPLGDVLCRDRTRELRPTRAIPRLGAPSVAGAASAEHRFDGVQRNESRLDRQRASGTGPQLTAKYLAANVAPAIARVPKEGESCRK